MSVCKRSSFSIEKEPPAVPLDKSTRWIFGNVGRPFLETIKRTDKECRVKWSCCGQKYDVTEKVSPGRYGGRELNHVAADEAPAKRGKAARPRWRGLVALLAACMFSISGSCIMWSTDAFHNFVANQMILDENKGSFAWWVTPPINPWFKVYIWNYTNWDEYMNNSSVKIKLQEVGPFTYKEVIQREAIKFDDKGITLSYREAKTYEFIPELSRADRNGTVKVPSLSFFGAMAKVDSLPGIFQSAGSAIFKLGAQMGQLGAFVSVKADELIWGYEDKLFTLSKLDPTGHKPPMDRVGLLTSKNKPDDMVILTGASDIDKLSYFVRYNNASSLNVWPDAACNTFEGSDGSMFPPRKVRAKEPVYAYKAEACRQIKFVFQQNSFAQGVRAHRYIIDRSTFASPRLNPANLCFCNETNLDECAPDGLFNTGPCLFGAPILISYPHFHLTDPKALEPFEGLHPDPLEHDMFADIHPRLGMTLQGRSRLQLNVRVMEAQPGLPRGMVLPVAWFSQDLPSYEGGFKTMLIVASYSLDITEFILLYVLPVVAILTAFVIVRKLLLLRAD